MMPRVGVWVRLIEKELASTHSLASLPLPCRPRTTDEANQITSSARTKFPFPSLSCGKGCNFEFDRAAHPYSFLCMVGSLPKPDFKSALLPTFWGTSCYTAVSLSHSTGLAVLSSFYSACHTLFPHQS